MWQQRKRVGTFSTEQLSDYASLTARKSGLRVGLPAATILVGAVLVVPLMWLLVAHWVGVPLGTVGTASDLLAVIGGVMGAVFTVGGLVIALVAVLTQLQLEDRVTRVLAETRKELEDRFEKELRPKYEEEAQKQIEGTLAFFQATLAGNWKEAERLTRQALDKYPKLQGARSFLGLRMAAVVIGEFTRALHQVPTTARSSFQPDWVVVDDEGHRFAVETKAPSPSAWFLVTDMAEARVAASALEPPILQAVSWLEDALRYGDNPEGQVSSALALMYGRNGAYDLMLQAMRDAIALNPAQKDYLTTPPHLAMLMYASNSDRSRIMQIGGTLGYALPASLDAIRETVDAINMKGFKQYVDWYALAIWRGHEPSKFPVLIRIFRRDDTSGDQEPQVFAYLFPHSGQQESFPRPSSENQSQPYLPLDEFVSRLSREFLFICPV